MKLNGRELRVASRNGKPIWVNFWFWIAVLCVIAIVSGILTSIKSDTSDKPATVDDFSNIYSNDLTGSEYDGQEEKSTSTANLVINGANTTNSSSPYDVPKPGFKYIAINLTITNNAMSCSNRISDSGINCEISAYNFKVIINGEVYDYEGCYMFENISDCFSNDLRFDTGSSFSKTVVYEVPIDVTTGTIEFDYGNETVVASDFQLSS